jgi:hypothetical protein
LWRSNEIKFEAVNCYVIKKAAIVYCVPVSVTSQLKFVRLPVLAAAVNVSVDRIDFSASRTVHFICVYHPFILDAVALIEQSEVEIKCLEREKISLSGSIVKRAFKKDQPDNPFELYDKWLGYKR